MMIAAIPRKYAEGATHAAPPKIAPATIAMKGSFAPQGIKVVVMIVILRSRSLSMVRLAMIPGTPQPEPISIGIKDLPDRPNLRKIRSMMNAIRAIYPQPSRNARKMNRIRICGTKPRTAPTPATIPSMIRPCSHRQGFHPSTVLKQKPGYREPIRRSQQDRELRRPYSFNNSDSVCKVCARYR